METYKVTIELTKHDVLEIAAALISLSQEYANDAQDIEAEKWRNKMMEQSDYAHELGRKFIKIHNQLKNSPF